MPTIPWTEAKTAIRPHDDTEIVIMACRFELHTWSHVPAFLVAALRIRRQMLASRGVLGISLIAQPVRKTFFTLSAWLDRDALDFAVPQQPHAKTMTWFHPRMAGSRFVFWTLPRSQLPPDWTDAMKRLEEAD